MGSAAISAFLAVSILLLALLVLGCGKAEPPPDLTRITNAIEDYTDDSGCYPEGVWVEDEQRSKFVAGGMYRIRARERDMKLDVDGEFYAELPEDDDIYVEVDDNTDFEIHQYWSGGGACVYFSNEEDKETRTTKAAERKRQAAQEAAEEKARQEQAARQRDIAEQQRKEEEQRRQAAEERLRRSAMSDSEILIEDCLDPFDGNHNGFEKLIREQLAHPRSMDTISTSWLESENNDYDRELYLGMRYRAQGANGLVFAMDAVALVEVDTCEVFVITYGWEE